MGPESSARGRNIVHWMPFARVCANQIAQGLIRSIRLRWTSAAQTTARNCIGVGAAARPDRRGFYRVLFVGNDSPQKRSELLPDLAELADRLAGEHGRLSELRIRDLEVRASFELNYRGFQEDERRAFLASLPG